MMAWEFEARKRRVSDLLSGIIRDLDVIGRPSYSQGDLAEHRILMFLDGETNLTIASLDGNQGGRKE